MTVDKTNDGTIRMLCFAGLLDLVRDTTGCAEGEEIHHLLRLPVKDAVCIERLAVGDEAEATIARRILTTALEKHNAMRLL